MLLMEAHLKAKTSAAIDSTIRDTASNAGPRFAFEGLTGRFPHVVPSVPAPQFATAEVEVAAEEGKAEMGEATALEGASLAVDGRSAAADGETEGVGEAEAADAADRTLGQKALLHAWTSVGEDC